MVRDQAIDSLLAEDVEREGVVAIVLIVGGLSGRGWRVALRLGAVGRPIFRDRSRASERCGVER
jgi:hypothetical protein